MVLGGKVDSWEWQYFGEVEGWSCGEANPVCKHYEASGVMRQWIELMGSGSDASG